jgi:DNA-binding Lrp family transcriptional regulator
LDEVVGVGKWSPMEYFGDDDYHKVMSWNATMKGQAKILGLTEDEVVTRIRSMLDQGSLSRFGPMINVEKMGGTFILAAMEVPAPRFESVATLVNSYPEVAHNYERAHRLNMWFVVATRTPERASEVCAEIAERTGIPVYPMPKEKEFFLELKLDV